MRIPKSLVPRLVWLILLLLSWRPSLRGQAHELSLQIKGVSGPDSPIRCSGLVSFHEELSADSVKTRWEIKARLENISKRPILAYEVVINAVPDHGAGVRHTEQADHFFRPELEFAPGSQEDLDVDTGALHVTPRKEGAEPVVPEASFKVIFVQFADGSKFGSSKWGGSLPSDRQQTIEQLQLVLEGFRSSGEQGLQAALARAIGRRENPALTDALLSRVKGTLETRGSGPAAAEVTGFLDTAQRRRPVM